MASLNITPQQIFGTLHRKNEVVPSGRVHLGSQDIRISPTGGVDTLDAIGDVLIRGAGGDSLVRLGDVATVRRGFLEPPQSLLYFDGKPAIGLGVSTVAGGNVVETGEAVKHCLRRLAPEEPVGMKLNVITFQAETVTEAVNGFLWNLIEALAIVIGLLMLVMGLRSGMIIGAVLLLDVLGTFVVMDAMDITLQRISLGALIIALGMLVDNAIVVTEGILVRLQQGVERLRAANESVDDVKWPLLGATLVAILAFAAISLSKDSAGEFLASLFQVIAISLLLSWVLAVTLTPLFAVMFLKPSAPDAVRDPYGGPFFSAYRRFLRGAIRHRVATILLMVALLVSAVVGFRFVNQSFFPDSSRPQFMVDWWRPEGTHIQDTAGDLREISDWLLQQPGVVNVTAFVGQGGLRFILPYAPEMPAASYGQLLVTVENHRQIDPLLEQTEGYLLETFPQAESRLRRFVFGPGGGSKIEARFSGEDPHVLRRLAGEAEAIMRADANAKDVTHDWRQRVPVLRPRFAQAPARGSGVSRPDLGVGLQVASSGATVGVYREDDKSLPILCRLPDAQREGVSHLYDASVWSGATGQVVPVSQVVSDVSLDWEDPVVRRLDRSRTLTVQCDPRVGVASPLFERLRPQIEAIELPPGYKLEWGGEYENSGDANRMLMANVPLCFGLMILIVVGLFNALRQPLIVFLTLPLALIGVTAGLLVTGKPFGFVALLGLLSLSGMLIKNAVVLLDQIEINKREGMAPLEAVLEAGVSRTRPVTMAAFTTVLGMAPLVFDVFWTAMAVTIMSGLTFATILTLVFVPVLYTLFFRISPQGTLHPGTRA